MRRDDLAWLAVFADPFTRLGGPVCDVIGSRRVILEDDDIPISRCGLYQVAHVSNAYSDGVSGPFFLHFATVRQHPHNRERPQVTWRQASRRPEE